MSGSYEHLSVEERALIQAQLQMGWKPAAIAAGLQRARSTISRELRRNGWQPEALSTPQGRRWGNGMYLARKAERRARQLRRKPRAERRLVPGTCQGRSKTRPVGRSKSRPVVDSQVVEYSGAKGLWSVAEEALRP